MSQNPLVSICIPTFNGSEFINDALVSAINQTYRPIEIIVSDDASSDKTLEIVSGYQKTRDISIEIINHKPQGIGANWNNCIEHSNGKYIKFLFQDDILSENCVEEMVNLAENSIEKPALVFSKRKLIGDLNNVNLNEYSQPNHPVIQDGSDILIDPKLFKYPRNKIGEPTSTLIRKEVFKKVGLFDLALKQSLDYECWYRICHHYKIGYIDKELASFRIHANQTTKTNSFKVVKDRYRLPLLLLKKHFSLLHYIVITELIYKLVTGLFAYVLYAIFQLAKRKSAS